jgi:hypothetical protein
MESQVKQVLVVASKTANSARLIKEIEARAATGGCRFTLLIPDARNREKANRTLELVLPPMRQAARAPVKGLVDGPDPFQSVQRAVQDGNFDEIIVSTLPRRVSRWLQRDLITRVGGAGSAGDGGGSQAGAGPDRRYRYPWMSLAVAGYRAPLAAGQGRLPDDNGRSCGRAV